MAAYISSLRTALALFPFAAILLTIPYIVSSYRKYGAVSRLRTLIVFSFVFYLLCAYCLVVFPLPDIATVEMMTTPTAQLIPLRFIRDFVKGTPFRIANPGTYLPALTDATVLQPLFNLLLTVPFGVYLAYYFQENRKKTILMAFLLSLFFEITQLTGLYGLYPRPYRLFDVDDLLLNTLGGYLGYLLGLRVMAYLPSRQAIDAENVRRGAYVTTLRRIAAITIDCALVTTAALLMDFFSPLRFGHAFIGLYFLYFVGLQKLLGGITAGKWFVNIKTASIRRTDRPSFRQLLARYGLPYALWIVSPLAFILLMTGDALCARRARHPLWYERISGTESRGDTRFIKTGASQMLTSTR